MNTGIVKWFNTVKGYGFITPDDGTPDAFVHITAVQESGLRLIVEGQRLKYQMIESKNGKLAAGNLELVGEEQEAV
ncbi:Flagellar hook-associated protein 3 FlgL [Candidatus Micropelagos thuwalensis]|jgi:CspA family cold shock protein|uniref:Flagellar hook-associated protein 3 FlgL n=2 Tax=PS1 clade TaxID=2175150 RepID=U2XTV5_9PROT|nr:cold-shock protein [Candidatus Micropelagos thuwalensis]MAV18706.1 cold-shock protein [Hyphomicrobiales bacterium]MEC7176711.1 cold-shock protein [Pseudomonadota bacterium]NCG11525.1 cold shock domain-containing protein [Alphaproteobacteria bacterium]OUV46680.1 MAG: cold-shock protein [Alphaproteobacteria bacterium TMED110]OUX19031.1 MAG: cold-shock protein [Rhizobiales bacterium TMED249]RCL75494.1 MAG: cold-shock protein [PS1 clade bacterium]HAK98516.1 cold-shock protein [Rhodobiaceae ba|tara:strand:+ start:19274 stop:19501 length:228 start_codon:yes stop_codon:yes gene_type:complete